MSKCKNPLAGLTHKKFIFRARAEEKLDAKWQIRIGDFNLESSLDDIDVLVLNITQTLVHPFYDGAAAYFDIGILKTDPIKLSMVCK